MPNPTLLATRAVIVSFAKQVLIPVAVIGYVAVLLIFSLLYWLASNYSLWWWVFGVPVFFITVIFTVLIVVVAMIIRKISPHMTKYQRRLAKSFVDEIANYSDLAGASRFFIAYVVIKDVIRKKPKAYINELTQKPGDLKRIFTRLQESYRE